MTARKIDLMYEFFGRSEGHRCGDCSNFVCGRNRSGILYKCKAYGLTHSEASDWAKRWEACGMFEKPYTGRPVIEIARRRDYHKSDAEEVEGQISIADLLHPSTDNEKND